MSWKRRRQPPFLFGAPASWPAGPPASPPA